MKIVNVVWGFALGAGIDKCFLTYAKMPIYDPDIKILNICICLKHKMPDTSILETIGTQLIIINNRRDFSWVKKLGQVIRSENCDVLFTHGFNGAIISFILKKSQKIKIPTILTYHGPYYAPTFVKKIISPIYNYLSIYIYKYHALNVISVNQESADYLEKKGVPKHKISVVHNGVKFDTEKAVIDLGLPSEKLKIISASRIDSVKGLKYLLEALELIKKQSISPFIYYMIGDGPELDSMKKLTEKLNLKDVVQFMGFKSNISDWNNNADIFVLPSLAEFHSIAILEAMSAGIAIIATNVGGNPESIRNEIDGLLVEPKQPAELANALIRLMEDESLRERLGKSAKQRFMENFTEEAMIKNIIKIIKK